MSRVKNILHELRYALYLTVHPFKGFWEIKHEKRGSLTSGLVILVFMVISDIAYGLYSGWLFNPDNGVNFNVMKSIITTLGVFWLWCISNWCLTCLFDGEGTFGDIVRATGYSLLPLAIIKVLLIPITQALSIREESFVSFLFALGVIWCGFLIFSSVLVTHQYTFTKTLVMIVCVVVGMAALAYIMLLFFNLIQQMGGFVYVLFTELRTRY